MFNKPPKFIESYDIIDIVNTIPSPQKTKPKTKVKNTEPVVIKEEVITIKEEIKPIIKDKPKTQEVKQFRFTGDDIPWIF